MGRGGHPDRSQLIVAARGLGVRYRSRVALADVDLDVAPGEIVGLLGPNGAGKSSLLRLIATGRRPTSGSLTILGHDARRATVALRRRIGVAGDELVHVDALTGRENAIAFARAAGLTGDAAAARVAALLPRFALDADADRAVGEYSLGMRRKLLLLEALAHVPDLLVLDEPTTGLDPAGREALRALLGERTAAGAAVVLATHDIAEAEALCTRVVLLAQGRVALEGAPAELIARLGAGTTFEFRVRAAAPPVVVCAGVTITAATTDRVVAHAADGSSPLPALCAAVLAAGAAIEAVEVRRPDLRDVFRQATGTELVA